MSWGEKYFAHIAELLEKIRETQTDKIIEAARLVVETTLGGHKIFIFGCTHAGILAQEAFYRTGGLAVFNPILPPGLTCDIKPITLTSALERQEEYGRIIIKNADIGRDDLLFIHSVSGRNGVPVEAALYAGSIGVKTVCITSLEYSRASASRHSSGKRLFEVCNTVIDNRGCFGDAALEIEGFKGRCAPTSTVAGAAIINAICAEAVGMFLEKGENPPVFLSANIDGGDEYNKDIMEKYKNLITYM